VRTETARVVDSRDRVSKGGRGGGVGEESTAGGEEGGSRRRGSTGDGSVDDPEAGGKSNIGHVLELHWHWHS